jgi:thioredoxin 1
LSEFRNISDNEFSKVVKSDKIVILDFWAEWCVPCKYIEKVLKEIKEKYENDIDIYKVNVQDTNIGTLFAVSSVPTLLIFKNGKPVANIIGSKSKEEIESIIQRYL